MNFALDEVLLRAFRRFWACGSFGGKKKKKQWEYHMDLGKLTEYKLCIILLVKLR